MNNESYGYGMLACQDLHFAFRPEQAVLRALDWSVAAGEVTAVAGPNGSGKTTLLRLLLGVLEPTRGNVTLGGRRASEIDPRELARVISYVPQKGGTEFAFTVREVLELGVMDARRADAVDRVAEQLSLAELMGRAANELSEGQRQRVTLARAIVQTETSSVPMCEKILLADEPFAAMDPRQERQAMNVLRHLATTGCGVVVVMHDLRAALRVGTQALLLDEQGRKKASGKVASVLTPENIEAVFGIVE